MLHLIASILIVIGFAFASPAQSDPLPVMDVTASGDDGNVPENTLDGLLDTRWSAHGDGQFITYELEVCETVSAVKIAWYVGDTRINHFDIEVSDDGVAFTQVHTGSSSGNTLELQTVDITDTPACFVRIVGHGNSNPDPFRAQWNSITEVQIEGVAAETVAIPLPLLQELCSQLPAQ